ncbi:target of Nesh-SH3 [Grus japonensis]|uniref:Target of Nesh-SH3 n=1 Tax=Grus japonensis TaxID=30415 RepID=A0ABC9VXY1_GRUJA
MMSRLVFLLFCGYIALNLGNAQKLPRVKRQSLKVQINATDDTICMRYLRPSQNTKLEGFVLGYGSNFFSNQYIPLPSEGKTYITELDAEPRYLVSVRPARVSNNKKSCSGRTKTQKPLQLVVGTLTPTSVFLSWGILVNPQHDWTATSNCASDRNVKNNKKGFFKYISSKRKTRENVGLLLNEVGDLVTDDTEEAELLNAFFTSVFTAKTDPQESQTLRVREKVSSKEDFPLVEEDWVRDHLGKLDTHKSMGPDGMHPRVLRELADVTAESLSIIFERSWRTGEVPENWRKASVIPVFKKGKKEDPGNDKPVSLSSIPGKGMEQLILDVISKHVEEEKDYWEWSAWIHQGEITLD